jgi:hypothetical protein
MSSAVSWWSVYEFTLPLVESVGHFPTAGTPAWCELADNDPRKIAAVYDAAQHHALRLELNQEAMAQASQAISAAENWKDVANEIGGRREAYIPREVA